MAPEGASGLTAAVHNWLSEELTGQIFSAQICKCDSMSAGVCNPPPIVNAIEPISVCLQ